MKEKIQISTDGLYVEFAVHDNGVVELTHLQPAGIGCKENCDEEHISPIVEVHFTGKTTRDMHGYKHNSSSASFDLKYQSHEKIECEKGSELIIHLKTDYDVYADYHMRFYKGVSAVRTWTRIENRGKENCPIEYISSFAYQHLCGNGEKPYFEKTEVYLPYNSWCCEAHWSRYDIEDLNLSRMPVKGFNLPDFGNNRFAYTGHSSWTSVEYLPMGYAHDREDDECYCFQVETSGQWHIEYDTEPGRRLALLLSGPTELEHGWWYDLKPGTAFETVPAAIAVALGGIDAATAEMTNYRRAMRRDNDDDLKLNLVFNDYMNCLMGDPTEEKDMEIIDKAAELGCEIFCMDCGWYDDGFWWDRVGEWIESKKRFPNGLKKVCDYAKSKGMVMGLWLEIEVMGTACELADKLPDSWFVCRHGKRHVDNKRYLLDFRNPEVRDYCMKVVDRLVDDYGVGFFKIDYNVTMGYGSDIDTLTPSGAILDHYRALYSWYEEVFRKHPHLVIENCGSGAMRMDYGMLRLLSLQSTSDQTDCVYNSYIGTNVASACTPEQAGMWVYPYEDDEEHVIYNMVNGLLLRPYISGMVWKLSDNSMKLLAEGISLYKKIREDVRISTPFFPFGFNNIKDEVLAYGLQNEKNAYLAVMLPLADSADIVLPFEKISSIEVIYPEKVNCEYSLEGSTLHVKMPQKTAGRLFKITL